MVQNHALRHMIQIVTSEVKCDEILHSVDFSVCLRGDPYGLAESPGVVDLDSSQGVRRKGCNWSLSLGR